MFGDNLSVDYEIAPAHIIKEKFPNFRTSPEDLGKYCMTVIDPDFPKKVRKGDIIVAGSNMGCGHDHVHGPQAIKGSGIAAVICESTNRNFFRNSIHIGLPIVEYKGIRNKTSQGDELEIDLQDGVIKNLRTHEILDFAPYPNFLLEILNADGIYPFLKRRIINGKYSA